MKKHRSEPWFARPPVVAPPARARPVTPGRPCPGRSAGWDRTGRTTATRRTSGTASALWHQQSDQSHVGGSSWHRSKAPTDAATTACRADRTGGGTNARTGTDRDTSISAASGELTARHKFTPLGSVRADPFLLLSNAWRYLRGDSAANCRYVTAMFHSVAMIVLSPGSALPS